MPSEKPPRMLIADDDPSIVRMLADRCARVGFDVDTATNGIQALIKANRSHPDVLVIDVNMPEADGLTVCARLLDPSKRALNVVVVTGSRETETVERCGALGAFYVRKGPDFWSGLSSALTDLFPPMADKIKELHHQPIRKKMRERPCILVIDDDFAGINNATFDSTERSPSVAAPICPSKEMTPTRVGSAPGPSLGNVAVRRTTTFNASRSHSGWFPLLNFAHRPQLNRPAAPRGGLAVLGRSR
jgi:CheY-like chemotaxis protein